MTVVDISIWTCEQFCYLLNISSFRLPQEVILLTVAGQIDLHFVSPLKTKTGINFDRFSAMACLRLIIFRKILNSILDLLLLPSLLRFCGVCTATTNLRAGRHCWNIAFVLFITLMFLFLLTAVNSSVSRRNLVLCLQASFLFQEKYI